LDLALRRRLEPEQRSRQPGPPRTNQPEDADDLAGPHLEIDRLQARSPRHAADPQHDLLGPRRFAAALVARGLLLDRMPEHHSHQPALVHVASVRRPDAGAVAKHGDPIRDLQDLGEPVRHVDDRDPGRAQVPDDAEQPARLGIRQCRRRLVEQKHTHLDRGRLRDLDQLPLRHPQVGDRAAAVHVQPDPLQVRSGCRVQPRPVDRSRATGGPSSEQDVLVDGQPRHEAQLLIHHRDAVRPRSVR
jgi:hypothetical protein